MRTGKVHCNSLMENCRPYQVTSAACLGSIVPLRRWGAVSGLYKSLVQKSSLSCVDHNSLLHREVMLVVLAIAGYFSIRDLCANSASFVEDLDLLI